MKVEDDSGSDDPGTDTGTSDVGACAGYAIFQSKVDVTVEGTCVACHSAGQGRNFEVTPSAKTNYSNAKAYLSLNPGHSCEQSELVARNLSGGGYTHPLAAFETDLEAYQAVCDWIAAEIASPCAE